MPVDDVELHEVGSLDAIIDIVGVALALEDLDVDRVVATPLPMGTGRIEAAHGALPLPAPATLDVLKGWPVVPSAWPGEWVTPTGAALVAGIAEPAAFPAMRIAATGYGAGRRDPGFVANLVRVVVGTDDTDGAATDVVELVCNVDDTTGELVADAIANLLEAGALDAWAVPATMKKGRPGLVVHALVHPHDEAPLTEALLRETSTLGVRRARRAAPCSIAGPRPSRPRGGPVRIKVGGRDGEAWHAAPEFDDVRARARAAGVPTQDVHRDAIARWHRLR